MLMVRMMMTPPLRGVCGSSNPPHSCLPPPERGVDDGDGDDALTQATSSSSITISKTIEKAIS